MNIAHSQERIKELIKQKEDLYESKISAIDSEIDKLRLNIVNRCTHPDEFLITKIESYEDEYGKSCDSWQEHLIICSICGKRVRVKSSFIKKYDKELSNLFQLSLLELKELR